MRFFSAVVFTLLAASPVAAQAPIQSTAAVQEEIRTLFRELVDAAQKRDRAALARLHAPEFIFIHRLGYIDSLEEHLADVVAGFRRAWWGTPGPFPGFGAPNEFFVYGDVAVLRGRNLTGDPPTVSTSIHVRRRGRWQIAQIQVSVLQPQRTAIAVAPATLATYAGRYLWSTDRQTTVTREGDTLFAEGRDLARRKLTPTAEGKFFDKAGAEWTFVKGPDGKVPHAVLRAPTGQETKGTKSNDQRAEV
jgi:hypothetical protein